jgi:hypothetical protein
LTLCITVLPRKTVIGLHAPWFVVGSSLQHWVYGVRHLE